ncbi:uncharacterized protein E0L32_009981 [Thyridium curvatum]|uniref:Uncharacterized protein n=1 Tax=Thyridium curvatum TaxID=1093900 RepID=A0A507APS6_9PEZI|nr:uncharacterized protein E0L32_009981 [Thyridium curvatum]TPX08494.1 hypothetical protein E0L32_009981 [Thyridium curvatum]
MGDRKRSTTSCLIVGGGISVPSSLYSYSFAQSPEWSETFAPQDEILNYLIKVSEDHDLYKYVRFNTALEGAEWDSIEKKWVCKLNVLGGKEIEMYQEYTVKADFLVTAVGQLNVPKWPTAPGLKDFKGKLMHSARWDWNYDIRGSTAVQIAPEVAKVASSFVIYQRSPHWLLPRDNSSISEGRKQMYRRFPALLHYDRASTMRYRESLHGAVTDVHSKEAVELEALAKEFIMSQLPNRPDLWAKLTPDYPVGCKRVVKSDDYLAIFRQKHVHLETSRITRIKSTGIECDEGETEFDLIICATGFETTSFFTDSLNIVGPDKDLQQIWKGGPRALYGMLAESLPNFAMLYGPNTNLGHNSIILMIEAQSRYISELVKEVVDARRKGDSLMIAPKRSALERFNKDLQSELNQSSFANPGCNSWYKNADGLITTNWSRNVVDYQRLLERVDWDDFELGRKADGLYMVGGCVW